MAEKTTEIEPRLNRIDFYRYRGHEFFEALFRSIDRELGDDEMRLERWGKLSPRQQGAHAWWSFISDVFNGGLTQYFYNFTDALVPTLQALLKAADCLPMVELLEQATHVYRENREAFAVENPFGSDGLFRA